MNDLVERLLGEQNECTLCWVTNDGRPAATTVSFVHLDGDIWMTALETSARVHALRRNSNATVVISGKGSDVGHSRCVSMQGICEITANKDVRDRFFPAFASVVLPDSKAGATMMANGMNSPENLVLIFKATKVMPYDAQAALDRANSL